MNRRAFFGLIAAGVAAAVDPEELLWTPRRKLISIPKPVPRRDYWELIEINGRLYRARMISATVFDFNSIDC